MVRRIIIGMVGFILWCCGIGTATAYDPEMGDYEAYPTFMINQIKPNILLILDNSGSMNFMAYGYHEDGNYHPDDFGAVVDGIIEGGDETTLVDNDASFTGKISVGDVLHNIDDGSNGIITAVTNDNTLEISGEMSNNNTNDSGERYWVEDARLKNPTKVEEGYYGYFVPTAKYTYSSNVFVRDDDSGQWSGTFLNWLSMRRVDVARKVLMGGLATSRTGGGNQHLIGETPAMTTHKFLKIVENPTGHSPYDNRHFYRIAGGYIEVYRLDDGEPGLDYSKDFTATGTGGDDQILADCVFDDLGNGTYEISRNDLILSGVADGIVDIPKDVNAFYKYVLYDPDTDFIGKVAAGDQFENLADNTTAVVGAVPASELDILNVPTTLWGAVTGENIIYDMFKNDGDGLDGYLKCTRCVPPAVVDYDLCQKEASASGCTNYLTTQNYLLTDLVGHLVFFKDPIDPSVPLGNNASDTYNFYRKIQATQVARLKIEVARDSTKTDEASDFVNGNLAGVLQNIGENRARFGLEFFNDQEGGKVVRYVGSNMSDLINQIQNTPCNTSTPLAETLYEGLRYYKQDTPYYAMGDFTQNNTWDPLYFNDLSRSVQCAKSFVLQITDGESTQDQNIPESLRDYDNDGNDPGTYESNGSDYLDDVALWGSTTDLRLDLDGTQNVKYYTIFAFGKGSTLLQDAARNGGFQDVNGDNRPEPPGGNAETIYLEWDNDQNGVPDTYFEAQNGFELKEKIYKAITDILKRAGSGTAVSVLSTSERGEGSVYQAFFKALVTEMTSDVTWLGYVQSLWVDEKGNLREDTVADNSLVLTEDKIIRYRFDQGTQQTYVDRFSDSNGNSIIDALEDLDGDGDPDNVEENGDPLPDASVTLENVQAIWKAGQLLALRDPADRTIYTFADSDWDKVVDTGEFLDFNLANIDSFKTYLDVIGDDISSYSYLGAAADRASNLVKFIRGEQISGMRNRTITVNGALKVWKLGDILFSSPTVVSQPMEAYDIIYGDRSYAAFVNKWKDRQGMVYVGANDGMLHAFRAGLFKSGDNSTTDKTEAGYYEETNLGSEAWAYIPFNLLPHLKWLADPDYTHVFYVDLKMKVADVKIFTEDVDHPGGWGTLLIGGMRFGGGPYPSGITIAGQEQVFRSAYFLIDVTNPENPNVLAEFTHPNLGFTTSYPSITKVGDNWYMIVGSGPTPGSLAPYSYEGTSDQAAKVFVLNLTQFMSTKQILVGQELNIKDGVNINAFMGNTISVDKYLDYSADVIYIGETCWASNRWNGRMYRLKTNDDTNPANWQLSTLFQTAGNQAITAAPSVTVGFGNDLWVYFGTGRLYNDQDKADTDTQSFYGIRDRCFETGGSCDEVLGSDVLDVTNAQVFTNDQSVTGVTGATDFSALEGFFGGDSLSKYGWKMNLTTSGERSLSKPSTLGGTVLFTTYIPDSDICSVGGDGRLYGLYFYTGTAFYKPILGEDTSTHESLKFQSMGEGLPASLGIHVGVGGSEESSIETTGLIQTSTGNIIKQSVKPPLNFTSGTTSWWLTDKW